MKNTTKILLAFSLALLPIITNAQHLGIEAGYNMTGLQQSNYGTTGDFSKLNGYHVGPKVELDLEENSNRFTMTLATLFEMRANRYDISWLKPSTSATMIVYYLDVPLNLTYRKEIGNKINWMMFGGPRLNFGLFGLTNQHYYLATVAQNKDTTPFASRSTLSKLDYAFGIGTGIELSHFQFMLGYDFPLSNSSKTDSPSQLRQHNFRFTIGYSFRKAKEIKY